MHSTHASAFIALAVMASSVSGSTHLSSFRHLLAITQSQPQQQDTVAQQQQQEHFSGFQRLLAAQNVADAGASPPASSLLPVSSSVAAAPESASNTANPSNTLGTPAIAGIASRVSRSAPTVTMFPPTKSRGKDAYISLDASRAMQQRAQGLQSIILAYEAKQPDELTLSVGDVVQILEMYDDSWCKGELVGSQGAVGKGKVGVFPAACWGYVASPIAADGALIV
ncbi:hypothetical protein BC830DRAFT_303834 [Chytriomyces sp. MP71]|nr:hypothetical protein BC830DRAFT_303834 [Chytriomyces sp. MP71]